MNSVCCSFTSEAPGFTVLLVCTQSPPSTPTPCRLLHSTSSPSALMLIYLSKALKPTFSKLSRTRALPSLRPKRCPTSRSDLLPSPGFAMPSPTLSTLLRGLRRSALLSSTSSGPSTRSRHSGRAPPLANRIFSAGAHGLPVPPGRPIRCFHYCCAHSADQLGWRHQHYAPAERSTSLGVRSYGVLRFPAGPNGH